MKGQVVFSKLNFTSSVELEKIVTEGMVERVGIFEGFFVDVEKMVIVEVVVGVENGVKFVFCPWKNYLVFGLLLPGIGRDFNQLMV
mgnify:CR=1 FL=1